MRVAAYYRVSSGKQRDRETIEGQRQEVRAFIQARGHDLVAEFEDDGRSARSKRELRIGLAELLRLVSSGGVDAVVTVALDRWTRAESLRERYDIIGEVQEAGVLLLESSGGRIDLSTFEGRLVASTKLELAAEESAEKSRRTKRGRIRAVREGRNPGRAPYGYACREGVWSTPRGEVVLEAYERTALGDSFAASAGAFNSRNYRSESGRPWTAVMVRDLVRRRDNGDPYVTGLWKAQPGEPAVAVPAIVPVELAARARAIVSARRQSPPPQARHVYLLDERACRCQECGGAIIITSCVGRRRKDGTRERYTYYACTNRYAAAPAGWRCTLPPRRVDAVDAAVWRAVLSWVDGHELAARTAAELVEQRDQAQADLAEAERHLAEDTARLEALAEALAARAISAESYREKVARVQGRRELLEQQVATWKAAAGGPMVVADAKARATLRMEVREIGADPASRRRLVRSRWPAWVMDRGGVAPVRSWADAESARPQLHRAIPIGRVAL